MSRIAFALVALTALAAFAQPSDPYASAVAAGPGVTSPHATYHPPPQYTALACTARVQGAILLQFVVHEKGVPAAIQVVSPLGYGLDERTMDVVRHWRFTPATKDGKPVRMISTAEVNFVLHGVSFDKKAEGQRTRYNQAVAALKNSKTPPPLLEKATQSLRDLAGQNYPPAMYTVGVLESTGELVPGDPAHGSDLIHKAAAAHYGPAIYQLAVAKWSARDTQGGGDQALQEIREAADLGSVHAQVFLGGLYENGESVSVDSVPATRYYRLCAAQGLAQCQYRLGNLLFSAPSRPAHDYIQSLAWLQLAAAQGIEEAQRLLADEEPKLSPAQSKEITVLKEKLVHR